MTPAARSCRPACASGSAPPRRAAGRTGCRRSAGSTARTRRPCSARSISAIGLSRSRLGSSTEIARMMIARSPLAMVPNARRSPWLAARPRLRCRHGRLNRVAAGRQIGDDDIVAVWPPALRRPPRRSPRRRRSASGHGSSAARPRVETCGTNSVAGMSAATPLPAPVPGTADAKPLLRLPAKTHQFEQVAAARPTTARTRRPCAAPAGCRRRCTACGHRARRSKAP